VSRRGWCFRGRRAQFLSCGVAAAALLPSACGSQIGMGRARTLDRGRLVLGASSELDVASAGQGEDQSIPVPWAQVGVAAHYGLHDRVEIGGRVWGFGLPNVAASYGAAVDSKFGVYRPDPTQKRLWNVATGLSLSYQQILYADAPQHIFGGTIPLLVGYDFGPHELVFGPRGAAFISTSYGQETVITVWPGASVGVAIAIGKTFELFPEMVLLYSPISLNGESSSEGRTGVAVLQLGLGANLRL